MAGLLVFALVLLLAVLLSGLANRSVLSMTVLFLVAGFLVGTGTTGLVDVSAGSEIVSLLARLALFAVLFTDGMRAGLHDLTSAWRLPGRALLLGMPITLFAIAALAFLTTDVGWGEAFLIGAILSPTDPVFAAAIVGRAGVPARLRHLLNVESGLNDGLALPVVLLALVALGGSESSAAVITLELAAGVVIGILIPLVALKAERTRYFSPAASVAALFPFAIGLTIYALCEVTHANLFLAAFSAGVTITSLDPGFRDSFHDFGQLLSELLKLAAVFVFASLISPTLLSEIPLGGYVFALLVIFVARPLAISIAFLGSGIGGREWAAAAWFGPKGFASVVYGLLVLESGIAGDDELFHLVAIAVIASIMLHSSTDVFVASRFPELSDPEPDPVAPGSGREDAED
jgi:NhaP-type Na+/H+ or K+/H+ antiporter